MPLYTQSARTSGTASGAVVWELRTASTERARIREIGLFMGTAVASVFGLGRPAAIGVTPTSNTAIVPLPLDPADAATTVTMAIAWGTAPTVPTNSVFLRRVGLPNVVGSGVIWTFPDPIVVSVSSSIALFNVAGAVVGLLDVYAVWEE